MTRSRPYRRSATDVLLGLIALAVAIGAGLLAGAGCASADTPSVRASAAKPSLKAYRGLASWVDLYDSRAFHDPSAAVDDMASHGVHTIFIETANYHTKSGVMHVWALKKFIVEAHAHHMYVVSWYLPSLQADGVDTSRVAQAIDFRTGDGQKFDSFALDIESTVVKSTAARNRRLASLTQWIRNRVGPRYPLGGIIPSPVALNRKKGYWDEFPYATVAKTYDVIMPMGYYTFHVHGAKPTYKETLANVRILRAQSQCSTIPIHLIGGIAEDSMTSEVRQFVRGVGKTRCFGASLYAWAGTTKAQWRELKAIKGGVAR